ncbi:hypothetical protein VTK26DRAFT_4337 [Humicola hyalothermophila]
MALPRYPSSRLSDVQLPIVLVPDDDDDDNMDPEGDPSRGMPRGQEESPPSSAPQHPIPSMQEAFSESLVEATNSNGVPKPKLRTGDARARREELLDQAKWDPHPTALWRRRPGQKAHELCRLMAQISFGVYLLLNGMANSQILVVSILQGHIDEVDEFLETTLEDVDLATKDVEGRIKHLKLPMDNIAVFERMLREPKFRSQIIEGNRKIEHILARAEVALKQTMEDLSEGLAATREFTIYLAEQQHGSWRRERPDVTDIFDAMKGNTDGWFNAFMDLQAKGSALNALIVRLTDMVAEMDRRANEAGRKTEEPSATPRTTPKHSPQPSDATSVTTPPSSPPMHIPSSPPRLSLRLSTINTGDLSINIGNQPGTVQEEEKEDAQDEERPESQLQVTSKPPLPESPPGSPGESCPPSGPQSPPARNPRRVSQRPEALLDAPELELPKEKENENENEKEKGKEEKEKENGRGNEEKGEKKDEKEDEEDTLYILQPRTYTPQPPTPQPSPRVFDRPPSTAPATHGQAAHSPAPSVESAAQLKLEQAKPRVEQIVAKPQTQTLRVVEIGGKADLRQPPPSRKPVPDPTQAPQLVSELEEGPISRATQRTSLRQRVSLKTNPPHAIRVPLRNGLDSQQPCEPAYRGYQAPDSAYGSDIERPPAHSVASIQTSLADFAPPFVQQGMIPSPHSERQFFRPVQANPYSPLQQRPHTSGTIEPQHFPVPPRNMPSRMGMSIMNSGTAMTNHTSSGKTVKKKRSAFGWLKKAFSLDEEERAAFEQRRREQTASPYQEPRSPQFLDGKRIRPRQGY